MGERVARDMIAVRIGPEIRMAAVATPDYFAKHGKPKTPQDLAHHTCINMRFATLGNVYAWEFEKGSREVNVKVEGQLTVNDIAVIRHAALNGVGIAFMPEDIAQLAYRERQTGSCARRLDPAISRLLPLLSQPTPAITRVRASRRGVALP